VYNCIIDGVRVPLVIYMVAGQPDDTGPNLGLNDEGVKVPSFLRALMSLPIARVEWCVRCFAEVFALPLLLAADDPMGLADEDGNGIPDLLEQAKNLSKTDAAALTTAPVFDAIRAGHHAVFVQGIQDALTAAGVTDPAVASAAAAKALQDATSAVTRQDPTAPVGDGPSAQLTLEPTATPSAQPATP
jgi:hypothetical protein